MKNILSSPNTADGDKSSKHRKIKIRNSHKIAVVTLLTLIFLISGAFAYNAVVINNPNNIWEESLQNTSKLFDEIDTTLQLDSSNSGTVSGDFNSMSPIDIKGTVNGLWSDNNSKYKVDTYVAGINANADVLVFGSDKVTDAELYFKIGGLDKVTPLLQLVQPELYSTLSEVNNTWYLVDKSNVDTSLIDDVITQEEPSSENITQIRKKIETVIRNSFASIESDNSLVIVNPVGREEHNGYKAYKYDLTIQKQQLIDQLNIVKSELSEDQINYLKKLTQTYSDENADLDNLIKKIEDSGKDSIKVQAWVDIDQKLLRNVRYSLQSDKSDSMQYVELNIGEEEDVGYTSSLAIMDMSSGNLDDSLSLLITNSIDKNKTLYNFGLNMTGMRKDEPISIEINLTLNSADVEVNETKPTDYKNATELIEQIMQIEALNSNN